MTPLEYVDKIREEKFCSCCMKKTKIEPHHINSVGMGRNRVKELIEHYSAIPVCRPCHQAYHKMGRMTFEFKFDVNVYDLALHYLSKHLFSYSELITKRENDETL